MKKLLVVIGIAGLAVGGWTIHSHDAVATDGGKLVADRLWIDHMPRGERDTVNVLIVTSKGDPIGVFQTGSRWRGEFELFKHQLRGNELRATFPHTNTTETIKVTATKCDTKGFDFCLELSGNKHGVQRYYSMEGWDAGSVGAAQARLAQLQGQ